MSRWKVIAHCINKNGEAFDITYAARATELQAVESVTSILQSSVDSPWYVVSSISVEAVR